MPRQKDIPQPPSHTFSGFSRTHHIRESSFLMSNFSLWNHPFYCAVCHPDFKPELVFKIGPILVVHIKSYPPSLIMKKTVKLKRKKCWYLKRSALMHWTQRNKPQLFTKYGWWKNQGKPPKNIIFCDVGQKWSVLNVFLDFSETIQGCELGFFPCVQCIK